MIVLGIETSCDDTSVAIVKSGKEVLSLVTANQDNFHKKYEGVVPEIASRKHLEAILPLVEDALTTANLSPKDIELFAVTATPGLIGSLMIGVNTAKTLSYCFKKPLVCVNHLAAHIYSLNLENEIIYPYIGILASGGHTMILKVNSPLNMELLGTTLDDACGEAFDKVSKFFNLGYPGGPNVDRVAQSGDPKAISYPSAGLKGKGNNFNLSYSGLKTAVLYNTSRYLNHGYTDTIENICASFQKAALEPFLEKAILATKEFQIPRIGIAGGVAANSFLRSLTEKAIKSHNIEIFLPSKKFCTDNGAMVAGLGYIKYQTDGEVVNKLSITAKPTQRRAEVIFDV